MPVTRLSIGEYKFKSLNVSSSGQSATFRGTFEFNVMNMGLTPVVGVSTSLKVVFPKARTPILEQEVNIGTIMPLGSVTKEVEFNNTITSSVAPSKASNVCSNKDKAEFGIEANHIGLILGSSESTENIVIDVDSMSCNIDSGSGNGDSIGTVEMNINRIREIQGGPPTGDGSYEISFTFFNNTSELVDIVEVEYWNDAAGIWETLDDDVVQGGRLIESVRSGSSASNTVTLSYDNEEDETGISITYRVAGDTSMLTAYEPLNF